MSQLLLDVVRDGFGKQNDIVLDTQILRLHSRVSFRLFIICSLLLTLKNLIGGDEISCLEDANKDKDENLNAYCWIQSTYSVVELFHSCNERGDCIYPGVGQTMVDSQTKFHTYYQWTSAALFFQAVLFYIPRFVWKCIENGLQKTLAYDRKLLFYPITSANSEEHETHLKHLIHYFKTHKGHHQFYFFKYCCCELLSIISVIVNLILIDVLLGHQFFNYGSSVLSFWMYDDGKSGDVSPMVKVFPLMAKCNPKRFGPSGGKITLDPICVLPLNSLNDKIYLVLWFYLIFVLIVSFLAFVYRVSTILFIRIRITLLKQNTGVVKNKVLEDICSKGYIGDWFVMYIMNNNVSKEFFRKFLENLWQETFEKTFSA